MLFAACHSMSVSSVDSYKWERRVTGETKIDVLMCNDKKIYAYVDSPVIGVSHMFLSRGDTLFTISDGTGKDILGSGVSVHPKAKKSLYLQDLDMDGDIDFVSYDDLRFGRYTDSRFAPLPDKIILNNQSDPSVLEYLNSNTSEQVAASDS